MPRRLCETIVCLLVALIGVGTWLISPFAVVSGSMSPTLLGPHCEFTCEHCGTRNFRPLEAELPLDGRLSCRGCERTGPRAAELPVTPGDRLLVDRTAFAVRNPRRWEVAALRLPHEPSKIAVKRIVGLPGETVSLRGGELYIDGRHEPRPAGLAHLALEKPRVPEPPTQWKLGGDEYFVLGDFPAVSDDSRLWQAGPGVAAQLLIGKPLIVHYPYRTLLWYGRPVHVPDVSSIRYIR